MSKLNIIEAMKMPIGTEFGVLLSSGNMRDYTVTLKVNHRVKTLISETGVLVIADESYIGATFIPIQQPVSLMEVVKSKSLCKLEHELLNDYYFFKEFDQLGTILSELSSNYDSDVIKQIFIEGKWYIEESEELEDERLS